MSLGFVIPGGHGANRNNYKNALTNKYLLQNDNKTLGRSLNIFK